MLRASALSLTFPAAPPRAPLLSSFTYGEVGTIVCDDEAEPLAAAAPSDGLGLGRSEPSQPQNCHANLMYSMLLFGAAKDRQDFDGARRLSYGGWTAREPGHRPLFRSLSSSHEDGVPFSLTYGLARSLSHSSHSSHSHESEVHSTDI